MMNASELTAQIVEAMTRPDLTLAGELASILTARTSGTADRHVTVPKLRHDRDQLAYLRARRLVGPDLDAVIARYTATLDRLRAQGIGDNTRLPYIAGDAGPGNTYGRFMHLAPAPRVAAALSPVWDRGDVQRSYHRRPGVVVIDDFLTPAALAGLRRFALESTVWSGNRYADGRLGAFFFGGFNCPLVLQIAEELRRALPELIGDRYPLRQLWAFKNTSELPADSTIHADFAAVNVNFWITPTEANRDPDSGGMVIYDIDAPPSWDFATYNERIDIIRDYLASRRPGVIRVPYRANRAVIFNSDLFHATEAVQFRPEYEHHRINVTMLYGERGADHHHPSTEPAPLATAWRSHAFRRGAR